MDEIEGNIYGLFFLLEMKVLGFISEFRVLGVGGNLDFRDFSIWEYDLF